MVDSEDEEVIEVGEVAEVETEVEEVETEVAEVEIEVDTDLLNLKLINTLNFNKVLKKKEHFRYVS